MSETVQMIDVKIPVDDFAKTHRALVLLLSRIEKAGAEGISTRELCDEVFHSHGDFCITWLQFAERQKYITRKPVPATGKGNVRKMNIITQEGKRLLSEIRKAS